MANRHLTCRVCGKSFISQHQRRYCSKECYLKRPTALPEATCPNCGKKFLAKAYHGRQKFCCRKCRFNYENSTTEAHQEVFCEKCGKKFTVYNSRMKWGNPRYCSKKCADDSRIVYQARRQRVNRIITLCEKCGKSFPHRITEPRRYCSHECANVARKINDPAFRRIRNGAWEKLRKQVFERDGGKCVRCGSTNRLTAHHVIPWRISHDDSLDNLVTLCGVCHPIVEGTDSKKFRKSKLQPYSLV